MASSPSGYMPQLDGLRGAAFFCIAAAHWLPIFSVWTFPLGWMSMMTFYALSGFLITGILLNARGQPLNHALKVFYARRILRIFPLYYAVVVAGLLLGMPRFTDNAPYLLTYTFNVWEFSHQHWLGAVSHLWTLSVEEQFYLVWPFLVLLLPERRLLPGLIAVFATAPVFRIAMYTLEPDLVMVGLLAPSCLDALGIGAIFALLKHRSDPRAETLAPLALWAGLALFIGCTALEDLANAPKAIGRISVTGSALLAGWLVWRTSQGWSGPLGTWLETPTMRYLGKISYGLYIFHNLSPILTRRLIGHDAPVWQAVPLDAVLTLGLAMLAWHSFEGPINQLKARVPYEAT